MMLSHLNYDLYSDKDIIGFIHQDINRSILPHTKNPMFYDTSQNYKYIGNLDEVRNLLNDESNNSFDRYSLIHAFLDDNYSRCSWNNDIIKLNVDPN